MSEAKKGNKDPMFGRINNKHPMFIITGDNHHFFDKTYLADMLTKISLAKGGGTIFVYDSQGIFLNIFSSTRKAAEYFNRNHSIILKYVKNKNFFRGKWRFTFSAKE
jgi:hypothetical protein